MKRTIILGLLLTAILILSGCGGYKADIFWEGVEVEVLELAEIPTDVYSDNEDRPSYYLALKVTGDPTDNFYGTEALGLFSMYDENGKQCFSYGILTGFNEDVLVKGDVTVTTLINCPSKTSEVLFIFRESTVEGLDTAGEKFKVLVTELKDEETLALLKELGEKQKAEEEVERQAQEQAQKEQEERIKRLQELQELGEQFEPKYEKCKEDDDQRAIDLCIQTEKETEVYGEGKKGIEGATEDCNQYWYISKYCKLLVIQELFSNSDDCKDAISNTYWWDCDDAFK